MRHVIVVGGGISGLAAAFYLQQDPRVTITLIERDARLGGLLETRLVDECRIEAGPDSFLTAKPAAMDLIRELGLADQVIPSNDHLRRTYILKQGTLVPMPAGLIMMAPTNMAALATSPLISVAGRLRAAQDLLRRPPETEPADRSIGDFVRDHYGQEFVEYLAEPLLTGVFGGDVDKLSVGQILPRFVELEAKYGSVTRGLALEKRPETGESLFQALQGGFSQLVEALDRALRVHRVQAVVTEVRPGAVKAGSTWTEGDHIVLGLRTWQMAPLLAGFDPELAQSLDAIPYSSAVTVGLTYPAEGFPHPLDGFGFLVPKAEQRQIVACTWVNRKFHHRAAPDKVVLRAFLGGDAWCEATDGEITAAVRQDIRDIMGVGQEPRAVSIARWPRSMPQYEVGHAARVTAILEQASRHPWLHLGGNAFDGIGIPDTIRRGRSLAQRILAGG